MVRVKMFTLLFVITVVLPMTSGFGAMIFDPSSSDGDISYDEYQPNLANPTDFDLNEFECRSTWSVQVYDSCIHDDQNQCGRAVFLPSYNDSHWACNCDFYCKVYGDCCKDFDDACHEFDWGEVLQTTTDRLALPIIDVNEDRTDVFDDDFSVWQQCDVQGFDRGIWTTHGCPAEWTDEHVLNLCRSDITEEDIQRLTLSNYIAMKTPVLALTDMMSFANIFCAICNGRSPADIVYYIGEWKCSGLIDNDEKDPESVIKALLDSPNCALKSNVPFDHPDIRSCVRYIDTCDRSLFTNTASYDTYTDRCQSEYSILDNPFADTYFLNKYCALCNGAEVVHCGITGYAMDSSISTPLSVLFKFKSNDEQSIVMKFTKTGEDEVISFNSTCTGDAYVFDAECRRTADDAMPIAALMERQISHVEGLLKLVESTANISVWMVTVTTKQTSNDVLLEELNSQELLTIKNKLVNDLKNHAQFLNSSTATGFQGNGTGLTMFLLFSVHETEFRVFSEICMESIETLLAVFETTVQFHLEPISYRSSQLSQASFCPKGRTNLIVIDYDDSYSLLLSHELVSFDNTDESYIWRSVKWVGVETVRESESRSNGVPSRHVGLQSIVEVCLPANLSCENRPILAIKEGEFSIDGSTIVRPLGTENVKTGDFEPVTSYLTGANYMYACFEEVLTNKWDDILGWVTLICTVLSLISLLLCIMFNILLPSFNNLPGRMTTSLCIALLLANILFLSTITLTHFQAVCTTMAIFSHYLWLASFVWMALLAFEICRVFVRQMYIPPSDEFKSKLLIRYSLIGWLLPALIVGVAVAIDYSGHPTLSVGYGKGDICWIADQTAFIVLFLSPVTVVSVFNILCFCAAFWRVRRTMSVNDKHIENKTYSTKKKQLLIGFRLASVLGLTWVVGIAEPFANHVIVDYIFTILNSSQGAFIFVALLPQYIGMITKTLPDYKKSSDTINTMRRTKSNDHSSTVADEMHDSVQSKGN